MATSRLKLLHEINPQAVRDNIASVFKQEMGNMTRTAETLGVSYTILHRLIKADPKLGKKLKALRKAMAEEGISQKGVGEWHMKRM